MTTEQHQEEKDESPSWYQWPFFSFVEPFLSEANRIDESRPLEVGDLMKLPSYMEPAACKEELAVEWNKELDKRDSGGGDPDIVTALVSTYGTRVILIGGGLRLLGDACQLAMPWVLSYFVAWLQSETAADYHGSYLVICLFLLSLLQSQFLNFSGIVSCSLT